MRPRDTDARYGLVAVLLLLWSCGGGGQQPGAGGSSPPVPPPPITLRFVPDVPATGATSHVVSLMLNTVESSGDVAVVDLIASNVDNTGTSSAIAADLRFDRSYVTFLGFDLDSAGVSRGLAAPLETDASNLVIGLQGVKVTSGRLAKLRFRVVPNGPASPLTFTSASLTYIDRSSKLLPNPVITGRGGSIRLG